MLIGPLTAVMRTTGVLSATENQWTRIMDMFYKIFVTERHDHASPDHPLGYIRLQDASFSVNSKMQSLQVKEMMG